MSDEHPLQQLVDNGVIERFENTNVKTTWRGSGEEHEHYRVFVKNGFTESTGPQSVFDVQRLVQKALGHTFFDIVDVDTGKVLGK